MTRDVSDVTHRKRGLRFEKSQWSWISASEEDGWLSELAEALRRLPHVVWGRWKSRHRKIIPLSSSCWKTFKLKGNKMFRTWTKKSSSALWTLWTFCVPVWICLFHVFMYEYGTFFFLFSTVLNLLNLAMNELILVKGIFRLVEIYL